MINKSQERHQHSGRSSQGLLDAEKILKETGLKSGDSFLDAGCGEGHFSLAASEIVGNKGKVYAFDIYQEGIDNLKKKIKTRNLKNTGAFITDITKKIPLKDKSIDIGLFSDVLHGLVANQEVEGFLKEISRVLRINGILAIVEFKKIDGPPGPQKNVRITLEEVEETITQYGFKKIKVIEAGIYHYGVIFKKGAE